MRRIVKGSLWYGRRSKEFSSKVKRNRSILKPIQVCKKIFPPLGGIIVATSGLYGDQLRHVEF